MAQFSDAEKLGSTAVKIEGKIGSKSGIDWFADDGVPTHIAVTASDNGIYTIATSAVGTAGTEDLSLGNQILSMADAQTGLSFRLEVSRQYKQAVWEFRCPVGRKAGPPGARGAYRGVI